MKKFLLMMGIVTASVVANAQEVKTLETSVLNSKNVKTAIMAKSQARKFNLTKAAKPLSVKASALKAAPTTIAGDYVEIMPYDEYTLCDSCTIKGISYTDETTGETYNVQLTFGMGTADVIGQYDSETGTITVPAQNCGTTTSYGTLTFYPATAAEQEGYYNLSDGNATFTVDEDGTIYLEDDAYFVLYDNNTDDSSDDGTYWSGVSVSFSPVNGEMGFYYYSQSNGWSDENPSSVAIIDNGNSIDVYNFLGGWGFGGAVTIDINDDNTVSMPTFQYLFPGTLFYGSQWSSYSETFGEYFSVYAYGEDGYLSSGQDIESIPGTLENDVITLDSNNQGMFFGSNYVEDQGAYGMQVGGVTITRTKGHFAGISDITVDNTQNGRIYNLNGQQVDKSYKGIVIKNGKKMLQK